MTTWNKEEDDREAVSEIGRVDKICLVLQRRERG
jgi:hypothetical protein